jgi:metallo-beta-lactamase family protein
MKLKFCGAAQTVTGSAHLLTLDNGTKILLDCGMYQGNDKEMDDFNRNWLFNPAELDCLILSHAHIDHSGRLPRLVKDGFQGTIFCTHATQSLCNIMLLDSAYIQERDAEWTNKRILKKNRLGKKELIEPLYTTQDVPPCIELFAGFPYNHWIRVNEWVEVLFKDAGHILGSASVTLRINENGRKTMIGFTGDIGRPNRPILRDPLPMPEVDYLISESTYGDREHTSAPAEAEKLLKIIKHTCIEKKGKLLIPAFSIGRTQELVYMLDQMATKGLLPRIPVYVDSPLAINATMVFGMHPECYDSQLNEYLLQDDNPFGFNGLKYTKEVEQSKALNESEDPCIIISSSGMMNAGRIRHHLYNNLDKKSTTLLIVGYCAPNTTGGILRSGVEAIKIFGDWKPVHAEIEIMDSFSAHADKNEMLEFMRNQRDRVKRLFLVHGEKDTQKAFQGTLNSFGFQNVEIPELGQEYVI